MAKTPTQRRTKGSTRKKAGVAGKVASSSAKKPGPSARQKAREEEAKRQADAYLKEMGLQGRYDAVVCVEAIEQLRQDLRVQRRTAPAKRSTQDWRQIMDGTGKLIDNTRRLMALAMDSGDRFESEAEARAFVAKLLEKWPNLLVFEVKHG